MQRCQSPVLLAAACWITTLTLVITIAADERWDATPTPFVPRGTTPVALITATSSAPTFVPIRKQRKGDDYVARVNIFCLVQHGARIVNHCVPPYYGPQRGN